MSCLVEGKRLLYALEPKFPKQSSVLSVSFRARCFPADCLIRAWHSCTLEQLMGGVNSTEVNLC